MSDELSELDELIESDVLEALGEKVAEEDSSIEIDGITIEDIEAPAETEEEPQETTEESLEEEPTKEPIFEEENTDTISQEISIEDLEPEVTTEPEINEEQEAESDKEEKVVTSTDLASLLSELLNNKTIEITIKIKD